MIIGGSLADDGIMPDETRMIMIHALVVSRRASPALRPGRPADSGVTVRPATASDSVTALLGRMFAFPTRLGTMADQVPRLGRQYGPARGPLAGPARQ